jgi:hypothetical protein
MNSEHLNSIAEGWFAAFNDHNLERLLGLYHNEAQHFSPKLREQHPETKGLIKGKALLHDWWQEAFVRFPSLKYEVIRLTPFEDRVFMEYVRHVIGQEDLFVGEMLEIKDSKIITSTVFHR